MYTWNINRKTQLWNIASSFHTHGIEQLLIFSSGSQVTSLTDHHHSHSLKSGLWREVDVSYKDVCHRLHSACMISSQIFSYSSYRHQSYIWCTCERSEVSEALYKQGKGVHSDNLNYHTKETVHFKTKFSVPYFLRVKSNINKSIQAIFCRLNGLRFYS